jgi:Transposase DDE domain
MPADHPLYQAIVEQLQLTIGGGGVRATTIPRLALLVLGLVAGRSCVLSQMAVEVWALRVTRARSVEAVGRRLRRALNDRWLTASTCYAPVLQQVLPWDRVLSRGQTIFLALDESSQDDRLHLLRVSVVYWGTGVPLAWSLWEQNVPLPDGQYWQQLEGVLDRVAAILPAGVQVVVLADRAYDVAPFVDRLAARGWDWIVRVKAEGAGRFRDRAGDEHAVRTLIRSHVPRPGHRWRAAGQLFKKAGWRPAALVAYWEFGQQAPLVVATSLRPTWDVLDWYGRRFWIEAEFRSEKAGGWQWEAAQVQGIAHHERLLVAMAWATLLVVCLGRQVARSQLARVTQRTQAGHPPPAPRRPRFSLFRLGLIATRAVLYRRILPALRWSLADPDGPSWADRWLLHHASLSAAA